MADICFLGHFGFTCRRSLILLLDLRSASDYAVCSKYFWQIPRNLILRSKFRSNPSIKTSVTNNANLFKLTWLFSQFNCVVFSYLETAFEILSTREKSGSDLFKECCQTLSRINLELGCEVVSRANKITRVARDLFDESYNLIRQSNE